MYPKLSIEITFLKFFRSQNNCKQIDEQNHADEADDGVDHVLNPFPSKTVQNA